MAIADTLSRTTTAFQDTVYRLADGFANAVVGVIIGVIFVAIGWIVGVAIKKIVTRILETLKVDEWAKEHDLTPAIGHLSLSSLVGSFVKWYVILIFLAQAATFVELAYVQTVLSALVFYIPILLGAAIIFLAGLMVGRFVRNKVLKTKHKFRDTAALLVELLIDYVALVIALQTVGFNVTILLDAFRISFSAFVVTAAIVVGLAFALSFRKEIKEAVLDIAKGFK